LKNISSARKLWVTLNRKNKLSLPPEIPMSNLRWILLPWVFVALFFLNLSFGSVSIPFSTIFEILIGKEAEPVMAGIIWDFRMTKALTCVLAGSALSVSGLMMQTLFRNALAGPDVLGITSGASLAVSLVFLGQSSGIALLGSTSAWSIAATASLGCLGVFLLMLAISSRLKDNVSLLIVGLMVGAATSSIVSVLQYISPAEDLQTYLIWTFGSLGALNWQEISVLALVLLVGTSITFVLSKPLNTWFLGENYSVSLGVNIKRTRLLIILAACLLTGAVTAFCGPLAFIGLAVPHLVKMFLRTHNHRVLIPSVMLGGASLLLGCDILAQIPSDQILPINAITALIGAPVVIWVILKNRIVE
jgi:iron complex transport system permease protein